jgi:hypothetical protein
MLRGSDKPGEPDAKTPPEVQAPSVKQVNTSLVMKMMTGTGLCILVLAEL